MPSNGPWNPPNRALTNSPPETYADGTPIPSQWSPLPPPPATPPVGENGGVLLIDFCGVSPTGPKPPGWILGGGGLAR